MVQLAVMWLGTLAALAVADDANCMLQSAPANARDLQAEDPQPAAFASGVSRVRELTCGPDFDEFDYNWTDPTGAVEPVSTLGPNIKLAGFTMNPSTSDRCLGAAIWTRTNNDANSEANGNGDLDLRKCPDGNVNSAIGCNILVARQKGSPAGLINDCAPQGSQFTTITLEFEVPTTVFDLKWWDSENGDNNQVTVVTDGGNTEIISVLEKADAQESDVPIFTEDVKTITLRLGGSGGVSSIRYCNPRPPTDPGAGMVGDPHIRTMDGQHYLLLSQGSFSLWHLTGLKSEVHSQFGTSTTDVDWQIYSHYSGHQSFAKGLLLVDRSGGKQRQLLELTSEDCTWRSKTPDNGWALVTRPQQISTDRATGFEVSEKNHVRFYMNGQDGRRDVAVMTYSCRPHHNIDLIIKMARAEDKKLVEGELRPARKLSLAQTTDEEYQQRESWTALGGSGAAAQYLQAMDEPGQMTDLVGKCDDAEKADAAKICKKHLGENMAKAVGVEADFFGDCVFDVCMGAGEVAAELAAELMVSTNSA